MTSDPRNFVDVFRDMAVPILARHPRLRCSWKEHSIDGGYTLWILRSAPTGIDVGVEVQSYAIYPFAGDWHGAPWEIARPEWTVIEMCGYALGLLRLLLTTDARLRVRYAGGRPYRWILETASPKGWQIREQHGLFLYSYFAPHSEQIFHNDQLLPLGLATGKATIEVYDRWR